MGYEVRPLGGAGPPFLQADACVFNVCDPCVGGIAKIALHHDFNLCVRSIPLRYTS